MIKRHCTLLGNTVSSQIFTDSDMEDSGNADESCFVQIYGAAFEKPSKYTQDTIIWVFQRRATAEREGRGLSQESSAGSQPGTSAGLSLADFSAAFVNANDTCFLSLFTQLHRQPLLVSCLLLWQALLVLCNSCSWPRKAGCVCFPLCTCLR